MRFEFFIKLGIQNSGLIIFWEEGRRKKEQGTRKKEQGRRKKEQGRRNKEEDIELTYCINFGLIGQPQIKADRRTSTQMHFKIICR
ncbi:MAG: hypothetical protein JGK26_25870 [Microcoleus sp. PH2017_27_LUM_O_A]|uniref:hypothetical protein n=1 Tax=unclassified Microcoleus TaxID=2642155 RepID=UPI001D6444C6|nr:MULTISPECIES: hypothetical protein [unclassified Microcoleus]MCC3531489.1 hypothetical protein [Microcoleus sp. PH2017_21_RUC_O_A]MCC3543795.1 hypothetical protein [Microcoleus sp. PH2017_22_RUC_O_B]MCC3562486.1 hypothetical protein [Microcoleus sp. PH2017_27_LUM_O_A]